MAQEVFRAYEARAGNLSELAKRFRVSLQCGKKIREQLKRTERKERVDQSRHGAVSCVTEAARAALRQMGLLRKKSLHAVERDSEENRARREAFLATVTSIPPEKLKFLDEGGVTTQMTWLWGRAPKGQRGAEARPEGHWQVLTTLGAMSLEGMVATMTVESATDGDVFEAFLKQVLCPMLRAGDVVVMDNLNVHKVKHVQELIQGAGVRLLYLPQTACPRSCRLLPCGVVSLRRTW